VLARGAALLAAGLMVGFTAALAANLARGIDVACGCFTVDPLAVPDGKWDLARDGLILLLALAVLWRTFQEAGRPRP
jgi:hypothetical protein